MNADKTDAATQKAKVNKPNVDCRRSSTPSVLSMNLHQPNAVVAASCRIGEDSENYISDRHNSPIRKQHVRGKWVWWISDTLTQQAMPAYVIDKGIASPELLSHAGIEVCRSFTVAPSAPDLSAGGY